MTEGDGTIRAGEIPDSDSRQRRRATRRGESEWSAVLMSHPVEANRSFIRRCCCFAECLSFYLFVCLFVGCSASDWSMVLSHPASVWLCATMWTRMAAVGGSDSDSTTSAHKQQLHNNRSGEPVGSIVHTKHCAITL